MLARILVSALVLTHAAATSQYTPPNQVIVTAEVSTSYDQQTRLYRYAYVFRNDPASTLEVGTILMPLNGAAVQSVSAPTGWTTGYSRIDDALTFDATEVVLPLDDVDDGSIPPSPFQIKQGQALGGFSFLSPDRPGAIFFHARGFTQLPVLGVDVIEPDEPGVRLPGPLDPSESFRGSTIGPVRGTGEPTSLTYFLHGIGSTANPATLVLNTVANTATTAKYKDSGSINFSGGNPWKQVGTWTANEALPSGSLTASGDLHIWLGLKNSDDQGTQFDVRAEVTRNGAVVASGTILCVTGVTRNPSLAKEVAVSVAVPEPEAFVTADVLELKILTRIGTNPDGSKCAGHNNAVGLQAYFDATSRSASFPLTFQP